MGFIFRSEADLLGPQRRETTWIETPRHDQVIFDTFPQIQIISRGLFEYMEKLKKKFKENKNDFFVSETTYSILIRRPDRPFYGDHLSLISNKIKNNTLVEMWKTIGI